MQRLENWYSQFKGYEKLTLKEAQEELRKISSVSDKKEKEQLLNDVVLKTLHYVYKFIKNKYVEQIVNSSSSYDIEDLINSACEEWIKNIYNGKILETENYNEILSKKFLFQTLIDMEENCENDRIVCPRDYGHWSSQNSYKMFINLFLEYVKLKNKNENITNEIFFKCMCEGFNDPTKGIYSQERELQHLQYIITNGLFNKEYLEKLVWELALIESEIEELNCKKRRYEEYINLKKDLETVNEEFEKNISDIERKQIVHKKRKILERMKQINPTGIVLRVLEEKITELYEKYFEKKSRLEKQSMLEKKLKEIKIETISKEYSTKEYSDEVFDFRRILRDTNVFDVIVRLYEILPKNPDGTLTVTKEELLLYKPTIMKMLNFEGLVFNDQMTSNSDISYVESLIDVQNGLNELNDREIDILFRRRAIAGGDKATLEEVSKRFNVSPESIRQIEKRAAHKLQFYMDPNSR